MFNEQKSVQEHDMFDERERRLFEREMAGVTPLSKSSNQPTTSTNFQDKTPTESQLARRQSAQAQDESDNFLSDEFVDLVTHDEPISYRRDGIQSGLLMKLEQGRYSIDTQLNLLKRPLRESRQEIFNFIKEAQQHQLRTLMIIHGRGRSFESPANILRSYIVKWLLQFEEVQAFSSAQSRHGGIGATYVVLRKSEKARQKNRERHLNRRGH